MADLHHVLLWAGARHEPSGAYARAWCPPVGRESHDHLRRTRVGPRQEPREGREGGAEESENNPGEEREGRGARGLLEKVSTVRKNSFATQCSILRKTFKAFCSSI